MDRAQDCRKTAEECRQLAARTQLPNHKERWLRIADHWMKLASDAEQHQNRQALASVKRNQISSFLVSKLLAELTDAEKAQVLGTTAL